MVDPKHTDRYPILNFHLRQKCTTASTICSGQASLVVQYLLNKFFRVQWACAVCSITEYSMFSGFLVV